MPRQRRNREGTATEFLDKVGNKVLASLVLPLITTLVAHWFTDSLGLITLQAVLVGAVLIAAPPVLWTKLRGRMSAWLLVLCCLLSEMLLMAGASQLTHKTIRLDAGFTGRSDLAARFQGPKVHGDETKYSYNTITLVRPPVLAEKGNVELHALLDFTWGTQTRILDPLCGQRRYLASMGLMSQTRSQSTGGQSHDPFEATDFSVTPQRGWCAWLFGWLETPTLLSESGFVTRWADEQIQERP